MGFHDKAIEARERAKRRRAGFEAAEGRRADRDNAEACRASEAGQYAEKFRPALECFMRVFISEMKPYSMDSRIVGVKLVETPEFLAKLQKEFADSEASPVGIISTSGLPRGITTSILSRMIPDEDDWIQRSNTFSMKIAVLGKLMEHFPGIPLRTDIQAAMDTAGRSTTNRR